MTRKRNIHTSSLYDAPLYTISQASKYVGLPSTTLKDWVRGRKYHRVDGEVNVSRLISPAQVDSPSLSFNNLVEAHVLRFLRSRQELPMDKIRQAIDYAQNALGVERLLLSKKLLTDKQNIFLERLSELINLTKGGQLAMKNILDSHLNRIEFRDDLLYGLYPFMPNNSDKRIVFISPKVSFGKPVTVTRHISTEVIADRYDAGEKIEFLAKDYNIDKEEIEQAIYYARAA